MSQFMFQCPNFLRDDDSFPLSSTCTCVRVRVCVWDKVTDK